MSDFSNYKTSKKYSHFQIDDREEALRGLRNIRHRIMYYTKLKLKKI